MFRRRRFNIDALTVSETESPDYSRITVIFDGNDASKKQLVEQLYKLPEVYSIPEGRVKPWGTAHAVLMGAEVINEPFVVINGDDYYGKESFKVLGDWLRAHEGRTGEYCLVGFQLENTLSESGGVSRGICSTDAEGVLTDVVEHQKIVAVVPEQLERR